MECQWKYCTNPLPEGRKKYCCEKCKNKCAVDSFRQRLKLKAVDYLGGKCVKCGYDRCVAALEFHHQDPTQKDFGVGEGGHTRAWDRVRLELDKCVLVCSNCHREIHFDLSRGVGTSGIATAC